MLLLVGSPAAPSAGARSGPSDPPEAAGPVHASAPPAWRAARREQRRLAAAKRRRRRLLLLTAIVPVGVLLWGIVSYTSWMVKPTSMSFSARSVEWVRSEVPFGNTIVDDVEHV